MSSGKNPSPSYIAIRVTLILTSLLALVLLISSDFKWILVLWIVLFAAACYFTVNYFVKHFIYRKIKLVYKTIHQQKTSKETQNIISQSDDLLDKVQKDVEQWSKDQNEKLDTLRNQEKFRKEFLANISHELKTPIFSIQGYIHTLLDGAVDDDTVKLRFLKKAAKNADRLQVLVEDLLAITRIEKGDIVLNIEKFDICALSKEVWEGVEVMAKNQNIKFNIKEGCDRVFMVEADRDEIKKVLENLFSNSIKYGKNNGNTTISFYEMGNNVLTEITDDGEGINEKDLDRLFERFYRVEKSRSRDMGGTGLGLSIVKHIIESHQQTINVRSTPGLGSTFGFTLKKA